MIARIVDILTLIVFPFVLWQKASKHFRERCGKKPKFLIAESLSVDSPQDRLSTEIWMSQEKTRASNRLVDFSCPKVPPALPR